MNPELFELYVETQLAPTLQPGDVIIPDNLSSHKSPWAADVTSRKVVRLFLEQLWSEFVPVRHGLQGHGDRQNSTPSVLLPAH